MTGRLVLVRHGETAWSATGRHTGLSDVPLTDEGVRQAQALAPELAQLPLAAVWTSPLGRASRTAQLAGRSDAVPDDDLREWDYGGYEGITTADISAQLGRPWSVWTDGVVAGTTPGEALRQVRGRVRRVLARAEPMLRAGETVGLFSHGHLLRVLAATWLGLPPSDGALLALSAGSLSVLTYEHDRPVLGLWNFVPAASP